jgi:hypothetical protein
VVFTASTLGFFVQIFWVSSEYVCKRTRCISVKCSLCPLRGKVRVTSQFVTRSTVGFLCQHSAGQSGDSSLLLGGYDYFKGRKYEVGRAFSKLDQSIAAASLITRHLGRNGEEDGVDVGEGALTADEQIKWSIPDLTAVAAVCSLHGTFLGKPSTDKI